MRNSYSRGTPRSNATADTSTATLSRLVGSLKGVSARRLRQEHPDHIRRYPWDAHFWSPSYLAASCGDAPHNIIKEYIENRKHPQ
uniref:IS200/IS605 family transposase n=1 Tax=Kitasatospora mediocidica TaxID=58352 RepID=UPI000AFDA568|nr:IS200/IS605 family transposase [Kitasatospora mediocidica]